MTVYKLNNDSFILKRDGKGKVFDKKKLIAEMLLDGVNEHELYMGLSSLFEGSNNRAEFGIFGGWIFSTEDRLLERERN